MTEGMNEDAHTILAMVADRMDEFAYDEVSSAVTGLLDRIEAAEAEVARLLAECADRESERADLRDRVQKAEAAVSRVEALADSLVWRRPEKSPCGSPEACCGSEASCDAMLPSVRVVGHGKIRAALKNGERTIP